MVYQVWRYSNNKPSEALMENGSLESQGYCTEIFTHPEFDTLIEVSEDQWEWAIANGYQVYGVPREEYLEWFKIYNFG